MSAPTAQPVVLVVDDTPANLGVLFTLLGQAGLAVLVAEDGESALARAARARPDLILLDVLMPELDGFETCVRLKADPATADIPVIFMTALSDPVDKVRGFDVGAVDYVTKPFQVDELLARVRAHLTIRQLRARLEESEARLSGVFASALDAIVTVDAKGAIALFNEAAERVFRVPAGAARGTPLGPLLGDQLRAALERHLADPGPGASWLPEGLTARRAGGEEFAVEATLSSAVVNGAALFTVILRDVEERRRAEAERQRLTGLAEALRDEVQSAAGGHEPVGASPALRAVLRSVEQVAPTDATVLVTGETGTGKELIARAIHARSRRRDAALIKVNCAAIPATLIESDLFGHEKGAFTGALARKIGRFELAHGGTLFLDEIGELPLDLQPKLLRALQEGEIERVGSTHTLQVDVRVVAATNRDLETASREGRFRADLYYRLAVFPIRLPPLRERAGDIPALVAHFIRKHQAKLGRRIDRVPERLMAGLVAYPWPGNVRELEHVIERAMIVSDGPELAAADWLREPAAAAAPGASASDGTLEDVERAHIVATLEATGWRVSGARGAAERLGLKPTTLESRMKKLGIARKR